MPKHWPIHASVDHWLNVGKARESVLIDLHAGRVPPVVDVESGGGEDDDNDEEYGHDHGGLARLAKGEDAAHLQRINSFNIHIPEQRLNKKLHLWHYYLVLAVRAGVVGVAGAAHVLRLDAHAAVLALADQRLRLRTALG